MTKRDIQIFKDSKGYGFSVPSKLNPKKRTKSLKRWKSERSAKLAAYREYGLDVEKNSVRKRNTTIIKAKKIGRLIIRKRPSVANPYAYQIQFQRPGEKVQHAGAYYTTSRADALKQAEADLKRRGLWKPRTKLITGAVPLNSVAARHKNAAPKKGTASKKVRKIREDFTGMKSRKTVMQNASKGSPRVLGKLGKLISIKANKKIVPANINPAPIIWLCSDAQGKLHLTTKNDRLIDGPARSFGEIKEIEYETAKPHLGYKKQTIFFHHMGEEGGKRPELVSDGAGGLKIKGGTYYITPEGIRD